MITLVRGDAAHLPLPDSSVDLVVTSPPYFALRSYQDNGSHYSGQIGSEATPGEFIDALIACTREWVRCLKPSGSLWVNLGDKYNSSPPSLTSETVTGLSGGRSFRSSRDRQKREMGVGQKSLLGLPWRYALRCIDDLGLILRAEVVWSKPNGLPESVTDRVRRSHEQWFHFTRQPRYYAAVDTIREPHAPWTLKAYAYEQANDYKRRTNHDRVDRGNAKDYAVANPLGKLPGSVWTIPSQPLTVPAELGVDHFAAFPMEWPRRLIQGWSPSGICVACGEGRRPVTDLRYLSIGDRFAGGTATAGRHRSGMRMGDGALATVTGEYCGCTPYTDHPGTGGWRPAETGWSAGAPIKAGRHSHTETGNYRNRPRTGPWREYHFDGVTPCGDNERGVGGESCRQADLGTGSVGAAPFTPPPTRPAVVLDPFSGTGTVALMADVLGRHGIGVDMSADYCRLARWRTSDSGERARAMQVDKPEAVVDGQMQLFDGLEPEPKRSAALGGGFAYAKAAGRTCETCPFGGQYVKGSCGNCDAA